MVTMNTTLNQGLGFSKSPKINSNSPSSASPEVADEQTQNEQVPDHVDTLLWKLSTPQERHALLKHKDAKGYQGAADSGTQETGGFILDEPIPVSTLQGAGYNLESFNVPNGPSEYFSIIPPGGIDNYPSTTSTIKAQVLSNLNQARDELVAYRDQHIQDFPEEAVKANVQLSTLNRVIANVESMSSEELKEAILQDPANRAEGFDEQYYLAQNPGVAVAVSNGDWGSALEHFEKYGYKEGRKGSADSLPYLTPTMESLGADLHDVSNDVIDGRLDHLINSKNMITTAFRNPELSGQDGELLTFAPVEGSLFVDGVSANDVKHGYAGNTMVTALLASIAEQNPQSIEEMITDHGDGTYTVHFKGIGDVIVDGTLPTLDGQPVFAHTPNGELWVAIIEKAYAQAKGDDGIGYDATRDINNNPDGGLQRLRLQQDILGGPDSGFNAQKSLKRVTPEELQANLESGMPIIAVAQGDRHFSSHMSDEVYDYGLAPGHAYSVVDTRIGVDGQTEVRLYNPWGRIEPGVGLGADENAVAADGQHDGAFWMSWDDFNTLFATVTGPVGEVHYTGTSGGGDIFGDIGDAIEDGVEAVGDAIEDIGDGIADVFGW